MKIEFKKYRRGDVRAIKYEECFLEEIEKLLQKNKITYELKFELKNMPLDLSEPPMSTTILIIHLFGKFMRCEPNDYLILGMNGNCYACQDDIFNMTYEKLEDKTS